MNAFQNNPSITLLAIDGNPLSTVPEDALATLNGTLRGLSLGGRFLVCDCKLRWITNWIRTKDLQVTSRERKPQFCGSPLRLHERSFYNIDPEGTTQILSLTISFFFFSNKLLLMNDLKKNVDYLQKWFVKDHPR